MKTKYFLFFFLFLKVCFSKVIFENSNFEEGNFKNWKISKGWSIVEPVYFPTEPIPFEKNFGFFSAESSPWGRNIIEFYTGKNIAPEKRVLISKEFIIDKPFITFTMEGNLDKGKNCVGIDLNSDGICDVKLKEEDIKEAVKRGFKRFFIDTSNLIGKKGSFVVSVKSPPKHMKILIDNIELEDYVPCYLELKEIKQNADKCEISFNISNFYQKEGKAKLKIIVYDFLTSIIFQKDLSYVVSPGKTIEEKVSFKLSDSPYYRIHIVSLTDADAISQYISKRWFLEENREGRKSILINDNWEFTKSDRKDIELPQENAVWEKGTPLKPSGSYGYRSPLWREKSAQVWYRKTLEIPEWFDKKNLCLYLDGGGGGILTVFFNGKEIDTENIFKYNGYRFLIPDFKKGKNEIILRFRNPEYYLRDEKGPFEPYWFYYGPSIGIFGNLYIENLPDIYISKVLIDPSYREKKLNLRVFVKNISGEEKRFKIDGFLLNKEGKRVLNIPANKFLTGAKEEKIFEISQRWKNPVLWSPDNPQLLSLNFQLTTDKEKDTFKERFGFREFWIKGNRILLNGYPVRIFDLTMLQTEKLYLAKKWQGANAKRAPWISYYGPMVHDEIGFLFRGLFEHIYPPKKYKNEEIKERYWKKYTEYEIRTMEFLYNHPACWGWVIGNELGGQGYFRIPDLKERYIKLAKLLSSIDPTRPVSSDGDLDLFGTTPIWNVHYPHEYGLAYGLPNNAYFFKKGVELMDWFPHPPYDGEKPVFLGEAFSGSNVSPDWLSPLGGEKVYEPISLFETWKKFFVIRQRAYRDQGVVGYEPFETFFYVKNFYPVDLFVKNYDHLFYGKRKIKREIVVFNDTFSFKNFILNWSFGNYQKGKIKLKMYPGEKKVVPLYIKLPGVKKREDIKFSIYLEENGKQVDKRWGRWEAIYSIFPKIKIKGKVFLYPYNAEIEKMLEFFGISVSKNISEVKTVITDGEFLKRKTQMEEFLANGGTIFVFDQKQDIENFPLLVKHSDTHSHILTPGHPLLKDINREDDFSLWGENNWISKKFYLKPIEKYGKVIVEGGDRQGLRFTNLFEIPQGRGKIIFCFLLLKENYKENPVVAYLFKNLIEYSESGNRDRSKKVGTLISDNALKTLKNAGFVFDDIAGIEKLEIGKYDTIWIDAEISEVDISAIKKFVENGGTLVLNRITPEILPVYKNLLPSDFKLIHSKKDIIRGGEVIKIKNHPVLEGINNYDFFWKKGTFERGGPKVRITAETSDFYISGEGIEILTSPPVLGIYNFKKGRVIIDQIKWDEALSRESKAMRSFINFAYNLGMPLENKTEVDKSKFKEIILPEIKNIEENLKIKVPERLKGSVLINNIPFLLKKPIILATGKNFSSPLSSVKVKVNSKAKKIHFLHTSAFGYIDYDKGKEIVRYNIKFKDKKNLKIEVKYGEEIFEYLSQDPGTLINTQQVTSFKEEGISLYLFTWQNPYTDDEIEEIEIIGQDEKIVPLVFGITVEMPDEEKKIERRREGLWSVKSRKEKEEKGRIWAIIGPFPNTPPPKGGYDYAFPPEKEIDFGKTYKGYGKEVRWEKYVQPEELFNKVIGIDRLELFEIKEGLDKENYVCYFYTKVYSEKEKEVILTCAFDDAGKVFLNGKVVIDRFKHKNPAIPGDYIAVVKLREGWNEILIKIVNNFLDCSFYFDIKRKDDKAIEKWKKGYKHAIAGLPSENLIYNAFAELKNEAIIPSFLYIETKGKKYLTDLICKPANAFSYSIEGKMVKVNFQKKGMETLSGIIPFEIDRGSFKTGTFKIKFFVPEGGSSSHILLAGRNAGGMNVGDVFIELLGGYPSEKYGGQKGKKSIPYQKIRIRYDRKEKAETVVIPVNEIFKEGIWNELFIEWGKEGLRFILNGKTIYEKKDDNLPLFDSHKGINLSLPSDIRERNQGEIYIKDIYLKSF